LSKPPAKPKDIKKSKKKKRGTFVGTPFYCAPEMLENNDSGLFSDLWALGCIIFEMCTGQKMFVGRNNQDVFNKILKNEIDFLDGIEPDAEKLILQLCNLEPKKRLGFKNIQKLKDNKFFEGIDWEMLGSQSYP
jgi:serine/threonine protein kinase